MSEANKNTALFWETALEAHLRHRTSAILYGNILDRFPGPTDDGRSIEQVVQDIARTVGCEQTRIFDAALTDELTPTQLNTNTTVRKELEPFLTDIHGQLKQTPTCWLLRNVQALFSRVGDWERDSWRLQEHLSRLLGAAPASHRFVFLFPDENRIPANFLTGAPGVARMPIPLPSQPERIKWAAASAQINQRLTNESEINAFVAMTDGLRWTDLESIRRKCGPNTDLPGLVREFKIGKSEDKWASLDRDRLKNGFEFITAGANPVLGQEDAVRKALAVVAKAHFDLSSVVSPSYNRPRGVLFFVGPTGVGKTMLAKKLAELVFLDENACVVFDMTEYRESHSGARLIGAPPGYTGHDDGGQLTRAVRNKPFCILLFDEIDKAHPALLMNFMQILDEGRLTDGKGQTCYFSECLIIFTSNAGATELSAPGQIIDGNDTVKIARGHDYEGLQRHYQDALQKTDIFAKHPEILSRIALQNIVPFRHLSDKNEVKKVVTGLIGNTKKVILEKRNMVVKFPQAEEICDHIAAKAKFETYGMRNVKQTFEMEVIEPLATEMLKGPRDIQVGFDNGAVRVSSTGKA